jgi:hypothetical protein
MLVGNNIMLVIYGIFMAHIIGYLILRHTDGQREQTATRTTSCNYLDRDA